MKKNLLLLIISALFAALAIGLYSTALYNAANSSNTTNEPMPTTPLEPTVRTTVPEDSEPTTTTGSTQTQTGSTEELDTEEPESLNEEDTNSTTEEPAGVPSPFSNPAPSATDDSNNGEGEI